MLITNKAARLITFGDVRVAPNASVELPKEYENNRIVKKMIEKGELAEGKVETAVTKSKKASKKEKTVDEMTKDELVAYAEGKGIDLSGADDKEAVLALIKAAEA